MDEYRFFSDFFGQICTVQVNVSFFDVVWTFHLFCCQRRHA